MTRTSASSLALALALVLAGCAGGAPAPAPAPRPVIHTTPQIITPNTTTTEPELVRKAEEALMQQQWKVAAEAFELLLASQPSGPQVPRYLFDLALAYEGQELRPKARDVYRDLARRFPTHANARPALTRAATLHAYLEEWKELGEVGEILLTRADVDDVDRIVGYGARGLSRVELGDDVPAGKDVHEGLDLIDRTHYATGNVLPVAAAQLRFALGEVRRVRSERIVFQPLPEDFLAKIEERCAGLLSAQSSYADAVRASDPHWAAMAGYRVGEMYRTLHHDLMAIPPPPQSKTEKQKQIFFAFMHVRYRVLLEKGVRQMEQTLALGERISDQTSWIKRAEAAKKEMVEALETERAEIAKFPFKESEIQAALDILAKKVAEDAKNRKP